MNAFRIQWVSFLLIPALLTPTPPQRSIPAPCDTPPPFNHQALSLPVASVAHGSDAFAWDHKVQKELWRRYSSLRGPQTVTWKDAKKGEHHLALTYEIATADPVSLQQIAEVILNFTKVLQKNGLLTDDQIQMVEWYRAHPRILQRIIREAMRGTPWTIVAKDPSGLIVAVVFPSIGQRGSADVLAPTMNAMKRWHKPFGRWESFEMWTARRRMMTDYWFMAYDYAETDGHGTIAESMLDKTVEVAQRLGIRRFFAYSNPVGYMTFSEKHPQPDIYDYTARVIAFTAMRRLLPIAKRGDIGNWETLFHHLWLMVDDHVVGDLALLLGQKIVIALDRFADAQRFPSQPTPEDFYSRLLVPFSRLYDQGGYTVNEPAIGVHLKRGMKLARIIENAFRTFRGKPEIGGRYSLDLQKELPLLPEKQKTRKEINAWMPPALLLTGAAIGLGWAIARAVSHRRKSAPRSRADVTLREAA